MLDWIKRIKAPPPNVQLVEDHPAPATEERLERLLVRLGSDKTASPESTVEAKGSTEADSSAAVVGGRAALDTNPSSDNPSAIDSSAPPASGAAIEGSPAIDPGLMAEIAAAVESAVATDNSTTGESSPGITPELAAEISAAIDSLDSSPSVTISLSTDDSLPAEEGLATDDELEPEDAPETGAILGTPGDAEIEDRVKVAGSLLTTRRTAAPVVASQMRIIAVCSQKGGSGKTTIAGHLAVQAGLAGHGPAVLIDTDPQGSLAEWWRARKDDVPALAKVKLEELDDNLAELRSYGTSVAIIDTPPALTGSIEQVMAIADLIVIPARPSPHDLRAVGATVAMCRRAGKPFVFVVNGAAQRANITVQAVAALSEHGRVSPVILYQRTEFAASMIDGRTVIESAPSGKSAQEIAELWKFLYAQINMRAAA